MLVMGIDIGAGTTKAVIMRDGQMISNTIMGTGAIVRLTAEKATEKALKKVDLSMEDLVFVVSTGYGRNAIPFSNKTVTEIICHAKGAKRLIPTTRTIIDIGAQDSKVIRIKDDGQVFEFSMNDKCAAGTGRFLEVMAEVLGTTVDKIGEISLASKDQCSISSTCTVFAETEVICLRAQGRNVEDLLAGLHKACAHRIAIMAREVGLEKEIVFTGGVAKNIGMKKALEKEVGFKLLIPEEPQIMGALGAALIAEEQA